MDKPKSGYGNVKPRFAKYFARKKNSAGPHSEPRRPDVSDEEYEEEKLMETPLQDVWVVLIKTVGQDTRIGPVFLDRKAAEEEAEKLSRNSSYANAYLVLRQLEGL